MYLTVTRTELRKNAAIFWGCSAITLQYSGWELVLGTDLQRASGRPEALTLLLTAGFQRPDMMCVGPTGKIVIELSMCSVGIKRP